MPVGCIRGAVMTGYPFNQRVSALEMCQGTPLPFSALVEGLMKHRQTGERSRVYGFESDNSQTPIRYIM